MNKERKKPMPIKMMIIVVFLASMTVLLTVFGVILFANWSASGERMAQQIASDLNEKIYSDLSVTLHAPFHINEAQHGVLQNEILDQLSEEQRIVVYMHYYEQLQVKDIANILDV